MAFAKHTFSEARTYDFNIEGLDDQIHHSVQHTIGQI